MNLNSYNFLSHLFSKIWKFLIGKFISHIQAVTGVREVSTPRKRFCVGIKPLIIFRDLISNKISFSQYQYFIFYDNLMIFQLLLLFLIFFLKSVVRIKKFLIWINTLYYKWSHKRLISAIIHVFYLSWLIINV